MSGYDAAKAGKIISVWWDMKDCPIPEGYDARRVRPSIERAFKDRGYTGPVSITAYADQTQTPCHVLRGLSSTGVAVAHTRPGSTCSHMYRDMVEWRGQNPPPATIMIISDQVEGDFSWDLARLQQRARYGLFLAYSMKQCNDYLLLCFANCRWEQLLEEEEGGAPLVADLGFSPAPMFYCKSCNFDCQSLNMFRKHLSSYKHGQQEAIKPPNTKLLSVTKSWARNYPATPEHATAKIHVLWDMKGCPIPEGYDARRVRPSIEMAFKELGYSGSVSITAFADQKIPVHHLLALSSTGVDFAHTVTWVHYSCMISEFVRWINDNPAPASIMIISDEVASSKSRSKLIGRRLQESNYKCFLAYSVRPSETPLLVTSAEWLWDSLLAVSETRRHILQKCSESERVVASSGMFSCKLCYCDCKSLDAFNKHLSSEEHTKEVGYPPKTKRMKKAPRKGFLPRTLRFTRR
ncbi:zinc finger protein-related [Raphanus sativus]|nr:zinc finger protein-related [Raphanus sativus]